MCFAHVILVIYAHKFVSNTLTGVNQRDVSVLMNIYVLFLTHALFHKRRTQHLLRVLVSFSHVNMEMYAQKLF